MTNVKYSLGLSSDRPSPEDVDGKVEVVPVVVVLRDDVRDLELDLASSSTS